VIVVDDLIDTGGTMLQVVDMLHQQGAKRIYLFASHGVFSSNAREKLDRSPVTECIVTNSIYSQQKGEKIVTISLGPLLADVIQRLDRKKTVGMEEKYSGDKN
jgi:ribose-phosphate pyrophosphokinase